MTPVAASIAPLASGNGINSVDENLALSAHHPPLEAVMGLASLGSPDEMSGVEQALVRAAREQKVEAERQERCKNREFLKPLLGTGIFKPTIDEAIAMTTLTNSNPRQAAALGGLSTHRHHCNALQHFAESSTLSTIAMLNNPSNGSWLIGHPLTSSFNANNLLCGPVTTTTRELNPMDRFSPLERLARERALAARSLHVHNPNPAPHESLPYYRAPTTALALPNMNFPETLFVVLSCSQYEDILSWLPHGRGFAVHDKKALADVILPQHFGGSSKYSSFTRRLKRWNFHRVPRGPELGAYYHKHFMRGSFALVQKMQFRSNSQFEESRKMSEEAREESEQGKTASEVQEQDPKTVIRRDEVTCQPDQRRPKPHPGQVLNIRKRQVLPMTIQSDRGGRMPPPSSLPKQSGVASNVAASTSSGNHPAMARADSLLAQLRRRLLSSPFAAPDGGNARGVGGVAATALSINGVAGRPGRPNASASPQSLDREVLERMVCNQKLQSSLENGSGQLVHPAASASPHSLDMGLLKRMVYDQVLQLRISSAIEPTSNQRPSHDNGGRSCHGRERESLSQHRAAGRLLRHPAASAPQPPLDAEMAERTLCNQHML